MDNKEMDYKKDVFILGAGASKPYGFPTGRELNNKIITNFFHSIYKWGQNKYHRYNDEKEKEFINDIKNNVTFTDIQPFYLKLFKIAISFIDKFSAVKDGTSIDKYISCHPDIEFIGKMAISCVILESQRDYLKRNFKDDSDIDWYPELFKILTSKIYSDKNFDEYFKNDIGFITFNYDTSFEYYFAYTFDKFTQKPTDEINFISNDERFENFNPIHIFGFFNTDKMKEFRIQKRVICQNDRWTAGAQINAYFDEYFELYKQSIGFNQPKNVTMKKWPDEIKIMYDTRPVGEEIKKARELIKNADRIFFLGFGYDDFNMIEILKLDELLGNKIRRIYGTAYNEDPDYCEQKTNKFYNYYYNKSKNLEHKKEHIKIINKDCLKLIHNYY